MEKTISINIGGVIFHIEEDGYQKLRGYLNSIHKYFSTFADNKEILSDIEGRIAERFLLKLKTDGKQAISLTDVEELIGAMGTVADFEAIEHADDLITDPLGVAAPSEGFTSDPLPSSTISAASSADRGKEPRKFVRDLQRKLAGGVAAGLAHRFSIDPLWIRLLFIFLVVGLPAGSGILGHADVTFVFVGGLTVLVYIAMWVAFPGSATLEEDKRVKKFYRNPDRKVIGGVAAGVASYFGVDLGVVRFLWVLSVLFFGTGLLVYLVLWVIAPTANTLTEKMEMQGEPITLSNIETNIKRGLDLEEKSGRENIITKILLLPFRVISILIEVLGRLFKGLGPIIRVLIGVVLVIIGSIALFSILVSVGVAMGLSDRVTFWAGPFQVIREIPGPLLLSGVLAVAAPFVLLLLAGLSLLANKKLVGPSVWLSVVGIWVVGILGTSVAGIAFATKFSRNGHFETTTHYRMPVKTLTLDERELENEGLDEDVGVQIIGYEGSDSIRLEKRLSAKGSSAAEARGFASQIQYNVVLEDSVLYFDERINLAEDSYFRDQSIGLTLYIPYNVPFIMTRGFYFDMLSTWGQKSLSNYELRSENINWNKLRWVVKRDSGLECINIPAEYVRTPAEESSEFEEEHGMNSFSLGERGGYIKHFALEGFDKINLDGRYFTSIRYGNAFSINADGEEEDVDNLRFTVKDGVLNVGRVDGGTFLEKHRENRLGLVITMPELKSLELGGATRTKVSGFENLNQLVLAVSGAAKAEVEVNAERMKVDVSGASRLILKGRAQAVEAVLSGACQVFATEMTIQHADIKASGASRAQMGRIPDLTQNADGVSKIEVRQE